MFVGMLYEDVLELVDFFKEAILTAEEYYGLTPGNRLKHVQIVDITESEYHAATFLGNDGKLRVQANLKVHSEHFKDEPIIQFDFSVTSRHLGLNEWKELVIGWTRREMALLLLKQEFFSRYTEREIVYKLRS